MSVKAVRAQCLSEGVNDAYRIFFAEIVVQPFRKQRSLAPVFLLNESNHPPPPTSHLTQDLLDDSLRDTVID